LDGQGIILMVPVTSIQKWDTGFSGGILNFESWYPSWIPRKNINFRPCISFILLAFISRKVLEIMFTRLFDGFVMLSP
jgi:hypothetical protein